jgi:hypothetical protein
VPSTTSTPLLDPHHTHYRREGEGADEEGREGVASEREERDLSVRGNGACVGMERGGGVRLKDEREGRIGRGTSGSGDRLT